MIFDGYWREGKSEKMNARVLADWADRFQNWGADQFLWALRKWQDDNPNKKPNPGHIKKLLEDRRGHAHAARVKQAPPDTARPERTDEQRKEADRIVESFARKHRPKPMQSQRKTDQNIDAARRAK